MREKNKSEGMNIRRKKTQKKHLKKTVERNEC